MMATSKRMRRNTKILGNYALLTLVALVFVLPIAFMLVSRLKSSDAIFAAL